MHSGFASASKTRGKIQPAKIEEDDDWGAAGVLPEEEMVW